MKTLSKSKGDNIFSDNDFQIKSGIRSCFEHFFILMARIQPTEASE